MKNMKEILEYNKRCAKFLSIKIDFDVADWSKYDDKSLTEHWNNNNKIWAHVPKGEGLAWYRVKHRGNFYQLFTDFTYKKLKESDIELGGEYNGKYYELKDLKFHSDWNWIMEVVNAIEKDYGISIVGGSVKKPTCVIYLSNLKAISGQGDTKKEAVIQAIDQFLIWYEK